MATISAVLPGITCAVEVFIAAALLHQENPERREFTIHEIVNRAAQENLSGELRQGVSVHASQHCCANKKPNPADHRMLFATGRSTRRLLLPGDEVHPDRRGKIFPDASELPERYLPLLEWAKDRYERGASPLNPGGSAPTSTEPDAPRRHLQVLLDLRLAGAHLANGEDPDDYVRRLREGWE